MADIACCSDNKCPRRTMCYRFTAEKDEYRQAYFSESPRKNGAVKCDEFWDNKGDPDPTDYTVSHLPPDSVKTVSEKKRMISMKEYNKLCDRIIAMGMPVHETLIKLLEEASRYTMSQKAGKNCDNYLKKMDKAGIKSQKRIFKELTKQKRKVHKP